MFAATNMMFASGLDPVIKAFKSASGATDLAANDALARYIRAQGLMEATRCYPLKSAQNAGSGSTFYGWGELTANNGTLVNSPTWGVGGVAFNGTNQNGAIADFMSAETLTVFVRSSVAEPVDTSPDYIVAQYDASANLRSVALAAYGASNLLVGPSDTALLRSSDGVTVDIYSDQSAVTWGAENTKVAQWIAGGGRAAWVNKTAESLALRVGTAQTQRLNSATNITIACSLASGSPTSFANMTAACVLFVQASITDAQREAITDLVNAL